MSLTPMDVLIVVVSISGGHNATRACSSPEMCTHEADSLLKECNIIYHSVFHAYPAAHSHVAFLIDAKAFSLANSRYTLYRPAFMDGVILHLTWQ